MVRSICKSIVAGVIALFTFLASPAQAQYPCSGAPGEQMVGTTNSGGATVPLCVPGSGPQAAPAPAETTHAALAWHPDAADVWVDGNWNGPNNGAQGGALAQCQRVMGSGCSIASVWNDSSQQIYRNHRGYLYVAWTYDKQEVKRIEAECQGETILPCEKVLRIHSSYDRDPGPEVRKRYLVAAWVGDVAKDDGRLYIASGEPSYAAAESKAMASCAAANPSTTCEVANFTGNGVLQTYLRGKDALASVQTSSKRAKQAAQAICKRDKAKSCVMQAQYDARRTGLFVHNYYPQGRPE